MDEDKKEYALKLQSQEVPEYELDILKELRNYKLQNVVRNYDNFVYKVGFMEQYCIIMDYCNVGDLQTFEKSLNYKIYNKQSFKYFFFNIKIALGIFELHQFKIIHRNIKPQNVLMHLQEDQLLVKYVILAFQKYQNMYQQKKETS